VKTVIALSAIFIVVPHSFLCHPALFFYVILHSFYVILVLDTRISAASICRDYPVKPDNDNIVKEELSSRT
jgi:hypothetical protein